MVLDGTAAGREHREEVLEKELAEAKSQLAQTAAEAAKAKEAECGLQMTAASLEAMVLQLQEQVKALKAQLAEPTTLAGAFPRVGE